VLLSLVWHKALPEPEPPLCFCVRLVCTFLLLRCVCRACTQKSAQQHNQNKAQSANVQNLPVSAPHPETQLWLWHAIDPM
jgi:hypothetical protein